MHNLSEQLLHDIGKQIVNGEILPGDILPKVEVLSEQRGVSRTVVREALKGLTARRLVESSTKIGTIVLNQKQWQWWDPDVILWATQSNRSLEFLKQLTEIRLAIEPAAVQLAAMNATEEDMTNIKTAFQNMESSNGNEQKMAESDYEFHNSILIASHNILMFNLVNTLRNALVHSRHTSIPAFKDNDFENSEDVLSRHKAVMEAICNRDGKEAYNKMFELLTLVGNVFNNQNSSLE